MNRKQIIDELIEKILDWVAGFFVIITVVLFMFSMLAFAYSAGGFGIIGLVILVGFFWGLYRLTDI